MKILVADDDALSRRLMERSLTQAGYDVVIAVNGNEALAMLSREDSPRLALLDWMMPGLDGPEVCRMVRAQTRMRYTYITLLTSRHENQDIVAGLEAGADDYLIKPCNPEELKARLRTGQRILQLEDKLVEAREAMRERATRDALTSLWNRGSILSLLKSEAARCKRENQPLSIVLCDVDHFKEVNDTHGHLVGDEVLRQVSALLVDAVRPYDVVGRYGGEEFLIVLGQCDANVLRARTETLRQVVSNARIETEAGPLQITLSLGGLTVNVFEGEFAPERLLSRVDAALYRAKMSGRNCVRFAESSGDRETEIEELPTVS